MAQFGTYLFIFLTVVVGQVTSDYCFDYGFSYRRYCPYGCCGSSGYQHCCSFGGGIAGIVTGCLVGLGLLITAIVICFCLRRRRAASGHVLRGHTNPWYTTTTTTTTNSGAPMMTQMAPGVYSPPPYQTVAPVTGGYPQAANPGAMYPQQPAIPDNKQYSGPPPSYDQLSH